MQTTLPEYALRLVLFCILAALLATYVVPEVTEKLSTIMEMATNPEVKVRL